MREIQVESAFKSSSTIPSAKSVPGLLASKLDARRAVQFLEELLNCDFQSAKARERFTRRFGDLCPPSWSPMTVMQLKTAWKEPVVQDREMWLLNAIAGALFESRIYREDAEGFEGAEAVIRQYDNLVAAIWQAAKLSDRLRVCANGTCPAPYFVARNRNQKFCSAACAGPSIRASKREWWAAERARKRKQGEKKSTRRRKKG